MAKKKKPTGKRAAVARQYIAEHPKATISEVVAALRRHGVTRQDVSNARRPLAAVRPASGLAAAGPKALRIEMDLPDGGLVLKLRNGHLLGTLQVSATGMRFAKPNGKRTSERELTWRALESLMRCGLLGD